MNFRTFIKGQEIVKTKIDIEKLVQWAVREELPKGQAVSASPWQVISQYCALGTRVDVSGHGDGLGFLGGEPHPDALIVGAAIRALDQFARFADRVEVLPLFGDLVEIAGHAPEAIMSASFDPRSIVISSATQGTRPKWKFDQPCARQVFVETLNERGEVRAMPLVHGLDAEGYEIAIKKNRGRARMRDGEFNASMRPRSPIEWHDPAPLSVAHSRAEWLAWHGALTSLAHDLADALREYAPTAPALPLMPWLDPAPLVARVILRDAFARYEAHGLPLAPKRHAGGKPIESPIEAETVASYKKASREKMRKPRAA